MKSKISFFLTGGLSVLMLGGFFHGLSSLNFAHLFILIISLSYLTYIIIKKIRSKTLQPLSFEAPQLKFYDELSAGLLFIIVSKAVFLTVADNVLPSYPLDILLLIILAYFHPLLHAILYALFASAIEVSYAYLNTAAASAAGSSYDVLMMFATAVAVNTLSNRAKKTKNRLEGLLKGMETSARELSHDKHDSNTPLASVSQEEKDRHSFDSAYKIADSLSNTLEMLKKILHCHNCILFSVDRNELTVIATASSKEDMCYEIPNESTGSLLGWIAEHKVPLRISYIRDRKGVRYYTRDVGINSFVGVPLFGDKDEVRAILCVDSKERDVFNHETERLLTVAAHGISEFLKNVSMLHHIKRETSEFAAFYKLSKRLGATLLMDEILDRAIHVSKEIVDYDMAAFIFKEDLETLKIVSAKGFKAQELMGKTFKMDETAISWVVKQGKPLVFSDFQKGKKDVPIIPGISPLCSFLILPLLIKDDTIGAFVMASRIKNFFSPYEMKIFEVIASHISIAISNARMYLQMEKLAVTDGLTGLFNHKYFQEKLSGEIERAERYNESLSILLIDIDHFKKVNDTYGHPAGDKILREVSKILVSSIRGIDIAARYGGEEFAVILVNTDDRGALDTAERIRTLIEDSTFDIGRTCIKITGSIGIAVFPDDTRQLDRAGCQRLLISKADSALYLAKREGRNRVYLFKNIAERIENKKKA